MRPCTTVYRIAPDFLELRVDHFLDHLSRLDSLAADPPRPTIITVRHPAEGGASPGLNALARRRMYARFLPVAAFIDIEIRSLRVMAGTLEEAKAASVQVIASFHDFEGVPPLSRLRDLAGRAIEAGSDVFKVAATVRTPGDLARLLDLLENEQRLPLSIMGMGPLGRVFTARPGRRRDRSSTTAISANAPRFPGNGQRRLCASASTNCPACDQRVGEATPERCSSAV